MLQPELHQLEAESEPQEKSAKLQTRHATELDAEVTKPTLRAAGAAAASLVPQFPFPLLKQASGPLTITRYTIVISSLRAEAKRQQTAAWFNTAICCMAACAHVYCERQYCGSQLV